MIFSEGRFVLHKYYECQGHTDILKFFLKKYLMRIKHISVKNRHSLIKMKDRAVSFNGIRYLVLCFILNEHFLHFFLIIDVKHYSCRYYLEHLMFVVVRYKCEQTNKNRYSTFIYESLLCEYSKYTGNCN